MRVILVMIAVFTFCSCEKDEGVIFSIEGAALEALLADATLRFRPHEVVVFCDGDEYSAMGFKGLRKGAFEYSLYGCSKGEGGLRLLQLETKMVVSGGVGYASCHCLVLGREVLLRQVSISSCEVSIDSGDVGISMGLFLNENGVVNIEKPYFMSVGSDIGSAAGSAPPTPDHPDAPKNNDESAPSPDEKGK